MDDALDHVVDLVLGVEAAEAEADRGVREVVTDGTATASVAGSILGTPVNGAGTAELSPIEKGGARLTFRITIGVRVPIIGGKVENKAAFMKALRNPGVVHDPRGDWKLDEYGNPVQTMYVRKVERKGGKLVNTVLKTYPNMGQFWTYDPKQFLASPVYSRDFPPAKNLEP